MIRRFDIYFYIFRTCSLWEMTCGEQGSCRLYDRHSFMLTWMGLHLVYKCIGLTCWLGAVLTYKPQPHSAEATQISIEPVSSIK